MTSLLQHGDLVLERLQLRRAGRFDVQRFHGHRPVPVRLVDRSERTGADALPDKDFLRLDVLQVERNINYLKTVAIYILITNKICA